MKTLNTRAMIEGAILAALTAIMGIFYNVPLIRAITLFWPVPIIIVGYRNGFKTSILAAIVAAILISIVVNPIIGMILLATYTLPGAVMGSMMRQNKNPFGIIVICGVIFAFSGIMEILLALEMMLDIKIISILANPIGALNSYNNEMLRQVTEAAEIYKQFGFDETMIKEVVDRFQVFMESIVKGLPFGLLFGGIALSFINYQAVRLVLGRIGYKIADVKRVSEWRLNPKYKYPIIGITFLVLTLMRSKNEVLSIVLTNIWGVLTFIFALLGVAVIAFLIEKLKEKHPISRAAHVFMLFFAIVICLPVLPYVGLFDMAADIRRFDKNTMGGAQ